MLSLTTRNTFRTLCNTITLLTILSATAAQTSCSSKHVSKEDMEHARLMGRQRALELASTEKIDSIKIESQLLDIRERETRLRNNGYPNAADAYIKSFMATLDSVNPSLTAKLK